MPKLAQEAHEAAMDSTVDSALQQAGVQAADLEAVAVTVGPGLSLCLKVIISVLVTDHQYHLIIWNEVLVRSSVLGGLMGRFDQCVVRYLDSQVGVRKARQLAAVHGLKYVPVHHMEAHALVARASMPVAFPFLCLLVSGGHNLLLIAHGVGRYSLLGSTLDDAVGAPCLAPWECRPGMWACTWMFQRLAMSLCTAAVGHRDGCHVQSTPDVWLLGWCSHNLSLMVS